MPSYDKPKLMRLLEQRRAAHLALRNISDRCREAKEGRDQFASRIRRDAELYRAPAGFVEQLLALPLTEASRLTADEVQGYHRQAGNATEIRQTGVNFQTYRTYLELREKVRRLDEQRAAGEAEWERFTIVPRLCAAVRAWGFPDPELEL